MIQYEEVPSPSLKQLSLIFLRLGNLTFGGGNPIMAAAQRELVSRRGWISEETYGLSYGLARLTPGTNVLAFCAALGWRLLGWPGAVAAVMAVALPPAVLVVWLTRGYEVWKGNALAMGAIAAALAAAVGIMGAAAWELIRPHLRGRNWARTLVLALGAAALSIVFSIPPIQLLALAAMIGFFWREPRG